MVVHVEHTAVATRAVMASFGFEYIAHQTISTALVLRITQVEAPEDRDLTWVCSHRLNERPNEHYEEDVEEAQENDNSGIV